MKKSVVLLSLLCSFSAFADKSKCTRAEYHGKGYMIDAGADGEKVPYRAHVLVKVADDGVKTITTQIETKDTVKHYTKVLTPGEHGTFTVTNDAGGTGSGYCVEKKLSMICHFDVNVNGIPLEETVHISHLSIDRMGSVVEASGRKFWTDSLHRAGH